MDMNKRTAFGTDDWTWQRRMMDAMITGLERANIGFTYVTVRILLITFGYNLIVVNLQPLELQSGK